MSPQIEHPLKVFLYAIVEWPSVCRKAKVSLVHASEALLHESPGLWSTTAARPLSLS